MSDIESVQLAAGSTIVTVGISGTVVPSVTDQTQRALDDASFTVYVTSIQGAVIAEFVSVPPNSGTTSPGTTSASSPDDSSDSAASGKEDSGVSNTLLIVIIAAVVGATMIMVVVVARKRRTSTATRPNSAVRPAIANPAYASSFQPMSGPDAGGETITSSPGDFTHGRQDTMC